MPGFLTMVSKHNLDIFSGNDLKEKENLQEVVNLFHSSLDKNCKFELLSDLISPIVVLKYSNDETTKSIFLQLKRNSIGTLLIDVRGKGQAIKFHLNSKIKENDIERLVKIINKES